MARAQYLASKQLQALHQRLGVPMVAMSAVMGTTVFASLGTQPNVWWRAAAGAMALLVAVLAALQTFFRYAERVEKHRATGAQFAAIKRRLDLLKLRINEGVLERANFLSELATLTEQFNDLETAGLDVPDRFYDRARWEEEVDTEGV